MLTNSQIADHLRTYADLLEMAGESGFRLNAYRRAAEAIRQFERPVAQEPDPRAVPTVGPGIAAIVVELVTTGRFQELDELQEQMPASLLGLLDVPGVGLKTAARLYHELGITSLEDLDATLRAGRLSTLKGMGPKVQGRIADGLAFLQQRSGRISIGTALPLAERLAAEIGAAISTQVHIAGSVRRMCETVGNIDLLVIGSTSSTVFASVADLPSIASQVDQGVDWATYLLQQGSALRVAVAPPEAAGTALIRWTGSVDHLVHLGGADALPLGANEFEVYATLGMAFIPPELRENRGEIDAAKQGRLPRLIEVGDLRGDLHLHSTWSDGAGEPEEMAAAAAELKYDYLAITDHSGGLGVAGGLRPERLNQQIEYVRGLNPAAPVHLLAGSEVEVHRDGRLDFDDDLLAALDLVVASLHSGLRQTEDEFTERMCRVIANPNVDIIAHPTGRLVERRQGANVDWSRVFEAAKQTTTALEINADPARLDMADLVAREAARAGVLIAIDSDAHHPGSLRNVRYGIGVARRAWIEASQVVNTWPLPDVLAWLAERKIPGQPT